ncbi:MAG: response regulator [Dissulfurispiraceae bacterium]|jgi:PleD family two-component response regulator
MENIIILIVEDAAPMRTFIKACIKSSFPGKVEVEEAGSGESAMTMLAAKPCDIVLCDWNLPGMKGTEILVWMKGQDRLKDIPFLMLTAHNEKDLVTGALNMGASDFIMKPVTAEVLSKRLMSAIRTVLAVRKSKAAEGDSAGGG